MSLGLWLSNLQSGKVDDAVDVWVLREDFIKGRLVGDVHLVECRALASDELDAIEAFLRGIVQVVDDDDVVASFLKSDDSVRANIAAAAINSSVISPSLQVQRIAG